MKPQSRRDRKGRRHQLGDLQDRRSVREFNRQLPLRDKLADDAVIRGVAPRRRGIVTAPRLRRGAECVRRARQRVQAWAAQRHNRVARNNRCEQEMSNDSRHRHIVGRPGKVPLDTLNNICAIVKPPFHVILIVRPISRQTIRLPQ